ncbi:MAG TPA: nucleotidyltransferase family protein [Desertimonas sp.]|nr:nucleotidyltransferase family protein [Desertimonas sp.]
MPSPPLVAIVLAAGEGRRFGGPGHKLDAEIDGRSLLRRALDAAVASRVGQVLLVVGDDVPRPVRTGVPDDVVTVVNSAWRDGSATSLQAGLTRAAELGADRAVIALGDQPFITAEAWRAVAGADADIAVATYAGKRGHPVQLRQVVWPLLPTQGDEGAKAVMRLRPDLVREIPCRGSADDIDTVEDLHRWQNSSSTSSP